MDNLSWVLPSRAKLKIGMATLPILRLKALLSLSRPHDLYGSPSGLLFFISIAIMNTSIQTETELSSVNSILMAIGQAPINRIYQKEKYNNNNTELVYINPEVAFVHSLLMEVNADVQNEGWVFNRENNLPLTPAEDGCIYVPENILRMDVYENDVYRTTDLVKRNGKLYDKLHHTFEFDPQRDIHFNIVWKWEYEELPSVFKRYITLRASGRAATQLVTNPQLVQLLGTQEAQTRAACMEYECNQGDHTFFGTPDGTSYRSYQPYRTLAR